MSTAMKAMKWLGTYLVFELHVSETLGHALEVAY